MMVGFSLVLAWLVGAAIWLLPDGGDIWAWLDAGAIMAATPVINPAIRVNTVETPICILPSSLDCDTREMRLARRGTMDHLVEHPSAGWNNLGEARVDRLDEWRRFAAVASRRSFAEAARALRCSPQSVTRAVAALEARLGVRLLNRTTRSVTLTSDGGRYLQRGVRLLSEFDALEHSQEGDAPLSGLLSLTAPVLFGHVHV